MPNHQSCDSNGIFCNSKNSIIVNIDIKRHLNKKRVYLKDLNSLFCEYSSIKYFLDIVLTFCEKVKNICFFKASYN